MENIREYVNYIWSEEFDTDTCYIRRDKCIDAVANKLLTMSENNQRAYCSIIIKYFWSYMIVDGDLHDAIDNIDNLVLVYDDEFKRDTSEAILLFIEISDIFECFNIDLNDESKKLGYKKMVPRSPDCSFIIKNKHPNRKTAEATTIQQWTIIRNLMECATGWRLTNNENELMYNKTDIAKFLSFLCGGSGDRIRKQLEKEIVAKDANAMMPYLENIGLHEIANKIKKDLE